MTSFPICITKTQMLWCYVMLKYPDFIRERVYSLCDATRWWYEYGKE